MFHSSNKSYIPNQALNCYNYSKRNQLLHLLFYYTKQYWLVLKYLFFYILKVYSVIKLKRLTFFRAIFLLIFMR